MTPPTATVERPTEETIETGVRPRDLVQFRAGDLAPALTARQRPELSASLLVKRDIARYYALVSAARHGLTFTDIEVRLIGEVAYTPSGLAGDEPPRRLLWAEVADVALRSPELFTQRGVDADALTAKLRALSQAELYALIELVEGSAPRPAALA